MMPDEVLVTNEPQCEHCGEPVSICAALTALRPLPAGTVVRHGPREYRISPSTGGLEVRNVSARADDDEEDEENPYDDGADRHDPHTLYDDRHRYPLSANCQPAYHDEDPNDMLMIPRLSDRVVSPAVNDNAVSYTPESYDLPVVQGPMPGFELVSRLSLVTNRLAPDARSSDLLPLPDPTLTFNPGAGGEPHYHDPDLLVPPTIVQNQR